MTTTALLTGLGLGFVIAAQVGPITLLCIRTVLRGRLASGLGIAVGVAAVDLAYAALGVAGAAQLLRVPPLRLALGLAGAAVIAGLGVKTLWHAFRIRLGGETDTEVATPWQALRTTLVATASNPLTILSWAAVFAAASTASVATDTTSTVALLAGVGAGSFAFYGLLSAVLAALRRRVPERGLVLVDAASGVGLVGFGGLLGWRALRDR